MLGFLRKGRFGAVRSFLLFAGYPRSGHTLVAALLDAHPEIVLSIEWGALSYLRMGFRKHAIYYSIERHSRLFTERLSNRWTGYSYRVEGQWQGRSDRIWLIGDKLAGQTSRILREHPGLLDRLREETGVELRILHVIRNPYDSISTMAHRAYEKSPARGKEPDLAGFSDLYFERVELMNALKEEGRYSIYDLYHEDLIANPEGELSGLLDFLGLGYDKAFLESCARIVYDSPHRSRYRVPWPEGLKNRVASEIGKYAFLARYDFEN